jgi:hypothetical protein
MPYLTSAFAPGPQELPWLLNQIKKSTKLTTMKRWVEPAFKLILNDNLETYRKSSDLGDQKGRTEVIDAVAEQIRARCEAKDLTIPTDLEKVLSIHCSKSDF